MIEIADRLKGKFKNVKSHLQLLVNSLLAKIKSLGPCQRKIACAAGVLILAS